MFREKIWIIYQNICERHKVSIPCNTMKEKITFIEQGEEMQENDVLYPDEIKKLIIREKGNVFWERFSRQMEEHQRQVFLDGYRYAIKVLEEGLVKK